MSGALNVKAALRVEGSNPEIRRFTVDATPGDVDLYQRVLTAVRNVFRLPDGGQATLFWKDEDEDMVQFSTTEELRHAVDVMNDDTLRIYVSFTLGDFEELIVPSSESEEEMTPDHGQGQGEAEGPEVTSERHVTFDVPLQSLGGRAPPQPWFFLPPGEWRRCRGLFMGAGPGKTGRKMRKAMCKQMKRVHKMRTAGARREFHAVRTQVPEEFRAWVRQYVRTWFDQGAEVAATISNTGANNSNSVPQGVPQGFALWLPLFLQRWTEQQACMSGPEDDLGMEVEAEAGAGKTKGKEGAGQEGEGEGLLPPPDGLPPTHYRWLCLFMDRFAARQHLIAASFADTDEDEAPQCPMRRWRHHGHGMCHGKGRSGCHGGKRGWKCKKGGKHRGCGSSSESEDSDCGGEKPWKQIPKEFRQYVRTTVKRLHKKKGDNFKAKEKAILAGISEEIMEFVQQILMEFHINLSQKPPRAVAMEMMEGDRSLPSGLEKLHFQWLCRFLLRWHRRHAGICDVMADWSSGETTDGTSGDDVEQRPGQAPQCPMRRWRHHGHGMCHGKGRSGCHGGKRGWKCKKGGKHRGCGSSSESEDSDCGGEKPWKQIPKEFRQYVRTTVKRLHKKKGDNFKAKEKAILAGISEEIMEFVQQILMEFHINLSQKPPRAVAMEMMEGDRSLPSGLEKLHFQWLCRFLLRWHRRHAGICDVMADWSSGETTDGTSGDDVEQRPGQDEAPQCPMRRWRHHGHGMCHGKGRSGCHGGKRGWKCKKGGKHRGCGSSSESEDSDCGGEKPWKQIPKEFRQYVRTTVKRLHKKKGDNFEAKEKAILAGISEEIMEFVQQILMEFHINLSQKPPRAVAMEMMEGDRSLPSGLEKLHFQWLCRFLLRWHRRHAGICDVMADWSSGEATDGTSGDDVEQRPGQGCGPWGGRGRRHFRHGMMGPWRGGCHGPSHFGMPGHHPPPFARPHDMGVPPFGGWHGRPMHPHHSMGFAGLGAMFAAGPQMMFPAGRHGVMCPDASPAMGCGPFHRRRCHWKRCGRQTERGSGQQPATSHDDMVDRVTEGVKSM